MNRTFLALTLATSFVALGCASESAPAEEEAPRVEAESEEVADFKESRGYHFASKRIDSLLDEIDATDAQRAKANTLKDNFAEELFSMKDDADEVRAEVLEEWKKDDPDAEAMHALVDERIEVYRKMMHKAVDGAFEMHEALTPEQREEIAEIAEERRRRWR